MQRIREGLSSMYEAVSREVRSMSRRDDRSSSRNSRSRYDDDRDSRAIDAPSMRGPVSRPREDARVDLYSAQVPAAVNGDSGKHPTNRHSLVMRLRRRRQKVRGLKANPALVAIGTTVITLLLLIVIVGGGVGTGYAISYYNAHAAQIGALSLNRALESTTIYSRDGVKLYSTFGNQDGSRIYISYCQIPDVVKHATIDTEDSSFYNNIGIDPSRIAAAVFTDIAKHQFDLGASTITQQLVKNGVLGDASKTADRKLNEAILAVGVTQNYTKQQILDMYLNIIFYGSQNYGIEAAAQNYFHLKAYAIPIDPKTKQIDPKDTNATDIAYVNAQRNMGCIPDGTSSIQISAAWQLKPWQATLLAGLPQSPSDYNPVIYPDAALDRQAQVVGRLIAQNDSNYLCDDPVARTNCHTPDQITQLTKAAIEPTGNNPKQIYASGFTDQNGQSTTLAPYFVNYVEQELAAIAPDYASSGWNVYTTLDYGDPNLTDADLANVDPSTGQIYDPITKAYRTNVHVGLQQYAEYAVRHYIQQNYIDYWYGFCNDPVNPYSCIAKNGTNYVPQQDNKFANKPGTLKLPLNNKLQLVNDGALVALDPRNGDILAMVGGVDFNNPAPMVGGQNNITTSKLRSMGSSFKPVVYATSFQMGWYPGSIISDQPVCFPADGATAGTQPQNDYALCPNNYVAHNFDYNKYAGPIPINIALGNSLNTPAAQTLEFVGARFSPPSPLIPMAQRLGITTLNPRFLGPSTALGAQEVPLIELTEAYGTFANNGYHVPRRSILAVQDALGNTIMYQDNTGKTQPLISPNPKPGGQAISPQAAFMITSILDDNNNRISDFGPDNPLHFWNRDVAAKTGTSQDTKDIVTIGYTPWMALGVWAGNADGTPMGNVIGISGAGYIFHDVMTFAMAHYNWPGTGPTKSSTPKTGGYFPVPPGLHRAVVNCQTGLAPYQGDPMPACQPAAEPVPLYLTPFFDPKAQSSKQSQLIPGKTWTCRTYACHDVVNNYGTDQKEPDITWMMDGLDPQSS